MKQQTLMHSSVIAAIIVASVIGVSMLTGFPGSGPFISIDPISDKNTGDTFTVTGTTSLPAGSEIMIEVVPASLDYNTGMVTDPKTGASVNVAPYVVTGMVTTGPVQNGITSWLFKVNPSSFMTGLYRVKAFTPKKDISGNATFTVLHPTAAETGQYIRVNPISDKKSGEVLEITGITNLAGGTNLMVEVSPASFESEKPDTGVFSGAVGGVDVVPGFGGINTWSMDVDTSQLLPTKYLVNVSVFASDTPAGSIVTTGPSNRTTFTVLPGSNDAGTAGNTGNAVAGGILIDPIRDTVRGKLLEVTGKTNLSAGTDLLVKINPVSIKDGKLAADQENMENFAVVRVVKGEGADNLFSAWFDTRLLTPSDYIITISNGNNGAATIRSGVGPLNGSLVFNIIEGTASPDQAGTNLSIPGIFINPVGDVKAGDTIIVTGTTNVPPGSTFLVSIIPESMDEAALQKDIANQKVSTMISAVRGSATANLLSVPVPTKDLAPGQYILFISAENYEVTSSLLFTVK